MLILPQLSLRRLLALVTAYSVLLGLLAGLDVMPIQMVAAVVVFIVFTVADLHFDWRRDSASKSTAVAMAIAFYATAGAAIVAACFALYCLLPEPPAPPQPQMPFWAGFLYLVSGGPARDIGDAIGRAIGIGLIYLSVLGMFSTIAMIAAILARRTFPSAKWFALLNGPGTVLFLVLATAYAFDH